MNTAAEAHFAKIGTRSRRGQSVRSRHVPPGSMLPPRRSGRRLVTELHAAGLLDALNRDLLAVFCATLSRYRKALAEIDKHGAVLKTLGGREYRSPWLLTAEECGRQLPRLAAELGLSMASRDKLGVAEAEPDVNDKTRFFKVLA
ncbi:MAG: phage terminase small subunit P27 family [Thermoguttaceae bacterium]